MQLSYQKKLLFLVIISAVMRLFFASATELSADEAYYWTYALHLQWNYFDHPPVVAWLIRLSTVNLLLHSELYVRLGAVICSAASTVLIFKAGTALYNSQAGWFAALLYTSSVYCSVRTGFNILPDSPQIVFWLASILLLFKMTSLPEGDRKSDLFWCLFGLTSGFCIMSKVHGVFLWLGVLVYMCIVNRSWVKSRGLYLSVIITLIIISPIIIWNVQNHFISFKFHGGRVSFGGHGFNLTWFFKAISEEMIAHNPINFFLVVIGIVQAVKGEIPGDAKKIKMLLFCSLPLIAVVLIISLFRETFSYWSGPGYTCLLILPAANLASVAKAKAGKLPVIIKFALTYVIIVAFLTICILNYFPGTLSLQKQGVKTGANDASLASYGWQEAGSKFDSLYKADVEKKIMPPNAPIIVTNWYPGASIEFYIAHKTGQEVLGIGEISDLHQYYWTNKDKRPLKNGDNAYFIVPSDSFNFRTTDEVNRFFAHNEVALVFPQYRSGIICRYITVYRLLLYQKK